MYYIYNQALRALIKKYYPFLLILIVLSCEKYEIQTIDGNQPPDEQVVTTDMKESYVNRLYITLLGRKADPQEFAASVQMLDQYADQMARKALMDSLAAKPEYKQQLYAIARADYLESLDTAVIRSDYEQAVDALNVVTGNAREYWLDRVERIGALLRIPGQLDSNLIDIIEVHSRVVNNPYYDNINMGTENFIVATFQHFLFRYPTNVELAECSDMVDGFPASLFFQAGSSKEDFLEIFFGSDDYFEGQVINLYRKYLFRTPDNTELLPVMNDYQQDKDYLALQKQILASDEYFFN